MTHFLTIAGWLVSAGWLLALGPLWMHLIKPRRLKDVSPDRSAEAPWPLLSVIVPARDEGDTIEKALKSLKDVDYPNLEIILINDRSRDQTGSVMDHMAHDDARIRVVHIDSLPAGWLGKNHAMQLGYQRSTGEYLLFTDGDVIFAPTSLRRAVNHMERLGCDHLAVYPELLPGTTLEKAAITMFGLLIMIRIQPWLVRTRIKQAYCGVGAFNLVRRSAYEGFGTHRRLALEVADDLKLGKLIKMHGYRQDIVTGEEQILIRWQVGLWGVVRGLEKNAFAGMNYRRRNLLFMTLLFVVMGLVPYLGIVVLSYPNHLGWTLALLLIHATLGAFHARLQQSPLLALLFPLNWSLFLFIVWRSAVITLKNGGVRWRDTFYPLKDLKQGLV